MIISINESCKILLDNGKEKINLELNKRNKGLIIEKFIWHEMYDFSSDCILMVLANDYYDESDYIRNYENFLKLLT